VYDYTTARLQCDLDIHLAPTIQKLVKTPDIESVIPIVQEAPPSIRMTKYNGLQNISMPLQPIASLLDQPQIARLSQMIDMG
jgi:hypothetical protein